MIGNIHFNPQSVSVNDDVPVPLTAPFQQWLEFSDRHAILAAAETLIQQCSPPSDASGFGSLWDEISLWLEELGLPQAVGARTLDHFFVAYDDQADPSRRGQQ